MSWSGCRSHSSKIPLFLKHQDTSQQPPSEIKLPWAEESKVYTHIYTGIIEEWLTALPGHLENTYKYID
jgi:hypothetical protein